MLDLKQYIREIPDFPKPGILFRDITPLLANPGAFTAAIEQMAEHYAGEKVDTIVAAEARGFIFAAPLAIRLQAGFVPIRKPGKLPSEKLVEEYALEYGTNRLEMHTDAVQPGQRVLIVDDLLATGGTALACTRLVEALGGKVVGLGFVIELTFLDGRGSLAGYPVVSLLQFGAGE